MSLLAAPPAFAQTSEPPPVVSPLLENVTRVEAWSFFEPPANGADSEYTLYGNRATLGMRVDGRRVAFQGSVRYAQLLGLPRQAFGPGPLGAGGDYFAAARTAQAYQLYFKSMSLRVNDVVPGLSLEGGRMALTAGEGTRFAGRLVGIAEWSVFERAFDGARVDYRKSAWRAHASFVMPTQGAFEESANPTMQKVQITSVGVARGGLALFAHRYRDTRPVRARPDNTGLFAAAADVNVRTVGATAAHNVAGIDLRGWAAVQRGSWYRDRHRAYSGIGEAGYQWSGGWNPAAEGGFSYASGDGSPFDRTHATFFPMVPTTADGLGATYAQMNLRDLYGRMRLEPHAKLALSGEIHRLWLADADDRWYSGTGATALRGEYFGYSVRSSRFATGLGTTFQAAAESAIRKYWSLKAAIAVVKGGEVVRRQFDGEWLGVFVLESRIRIP